ncbi:DNA replication ATP-dependent helicase/nuclease DNA2 [Spodoptera litura]|uniref:DNA replication ATP-dependent helicase/nuclease n=1 Tax=Spodoptera litura TaxID=69820 RepID=A0A9J7J0C6_SPOLT|nr:DNA replication ATP-dependent helicase/nuclease DNA2 [Spodoptera litura]
MRKTLSLKKAGPSKNQKSITDFLKSANNGTNQSQKPLAADKKDSVQERITDNKTAKRKASLIIDDNDFEEFDENPNNGRSKSTPKKIKTENKTESPYFKNSPKKRSPNKENIFTKTMSPKKNLMIYFDASGSKNTKESDKSSPKLGKISLTPPNAKNSIDNHVSPDKTNNSVNDKSCIFQNGDKVDHKRGVVTPKKLSPINSNGHVPSPKLRRSKTPKKSPLQEFFCSPINILSTPEKILTEILSPSKSGSTVKVLDFGTEELCDDFGDEWDLNDMEEDGIENLDLTTMQRCEILSAKNVTNRIELKLKSADDKRATCFVEGFWIDTPLVPGDIVSVLASRDSSGHYIVTNTSGLLVLRPDHLISSTSVVAGVFCKRKAVLQERWRGIDSANMAMTTGILIHELVQIALSDKITATDRLRSVTDDIIKESVERLFDAGLSEEEARNVVYKYIPPLADFMNTYVADKPPTVANVKTDKNNWSGHIDKILDIEENLCCPKLGLKGKIDATVQVTIHERNGRKKAVVPLELKSGKASMSAEHRGQLVLYGMMLNLQANEDPTQAAQRGLLLYLKDRVDIREVSCGYPERRDLIMLRNQLVQYVTTSPQDIDPENLLDIEEAALMLHQKLPEPVDHHSACTKCPYLTLCSLHLWHTDGPTVSESHPLSNLQGEALGHLSPQHIQYFLHWTALLRMEERGQMVTSPLHALWTDSVEKREKRGTCAANLKLLAVTHLEDRYLHVFRRNIGDNGDADVKMPKGPQEGEFSIVSIKDRPWIAAGVVTVANNKEIHIFLERNLSSRLSKQTVYHIDTYESYATTVQNLTNLGVLLEDSDRAYRLRRLIIDKELPQFEAKLPRDVGRLGTRLMKSLNIQQQRAVLKAIAAKDYALMKGLPGTGKTQTISVLIQMLVALKQRVLVTAHTHSAVDTVLSRLPTSLRVMRLGSRARLAAELQPRSELTLAAHCGTPGELAALYDSMEVVGVTCLGAAHAMLARTTFDLCIVDEATQVLQCTVLRPLFAAKKFVLVGDPEQLPPVVRSRAARRLGMEESLFHRLMCEEATSTLQLQYRMNQALADVANRVAYDNRLQCADSNIAQARLTIDVQKIPQLSISPWLSMACSPEPQYAALFLDVMCHNIEDAPDAPNKNSCSNPIEACVVIALVEALKEGNVKPSDIGVIAPYRDQVSLLRRSLQHLAVEVSTVDQFQGRDKPVIIYSCTKRSGKHDDKKVKEGEVLNDQRRLAVSVTRAKHKLLVVGNSIALRRYAPLQKLIQTCTSTQLDTNIVNKLCNKYKMYVS